MGTKPRERSVSPSSAQSLTRLHFRIQVNHLSTALVSLLLLPIMTKTAKTYGTASRLAIVSSEMHYMAKITPTLMAAPAIFEAMASKEYSTNR
jgi:retinol dehydrogenase-12